MRTLSNAHRTNIQAQHSSDVLLMAATITHPSLVSPIRVITEDIEGVSYKNGLVVNYRIDDLLYYGMPFSWSYLTDDDNPPKAQITFLTTSQKIGRSIRQLRFSPRIHLTEYRSSDFLLTVDADNARNPSGTPEVVYDANFLFLENVQGDDITITADVVGFKIADEPCPSIRTTQDLCPGLYR